MAMDVPYDSGMGGSAIGAAAGGAMPRREMRAAVLSAAALYVTGGALIVTSVLLPHVSSPVGAAAVAVSAMITAASLTALVLSGRASLRLAWVADAWGIVHIGVLCASTGGSQSPFALLYFFAIGHAAAFQPRRPFMWVWAIGLAAFLLPVAYEDVSSTFGAIAVVGGVLALLTTGVIHSALGRMREGRSNLEFLIAATGQLDASLDPQATLRRIAATAVPSLAELCVVDVLGSEGMIATTVADGRDPQLARSVEAMHDANPPDLHAAGGPIVEALASGRARVLGGTADASSPATGPHDRDHPHRELMHESGYHTLVAIPMVARGRTLGTISFLREQPFTAAQLQLLEDLTGRASLALDNARLYAERAHVAHTLRHSLIPAALPDVPGLQLDSFFLPMSAGSEVGGDFYDVFGDQRCCWMVVGDVCGKGPEAAVLTGFLRHTTVAYVRDGEGPASVLGRVNSAMLQHDFEGRFATAILARLEISGEQVEVTLAAAGHPAALVSRAAGGAEELGAAGTLLGVFSDPRISESRATMYPGDSLTLYTDGLTEAHAPYRVLTVHDMIEQLSGTAPRSPREAIAALLALVDLDGGARDDIAILTAQVAPRQRGEPSPAALHRAARS
jgi:serine phosphatase RsbU (regulator of sigma subunit)